MSWREVLQLLARLISVVQMILVEIRRGSPELDQAAEFVARKLNGDELAAEEAPDVPAGKGRA